jgi:putative acetyltransferase
MIVRDEAAADIRAIFAITELAFRGHPHSIHNEPFIVDALRAAGALAVSLVAEMEGKIVGHIAFSAVAVSDGSQGWYGLGPVSVLPELQRRGVGSSLVRQGVARLVALGAGGCVLVGDPGYYARFGFRAVPGLVYEGVPPEYVLALPLGSHPVRGAVTFHPAFGATPCRQA